MCPDNAFFQGVACNCVKIQLEALKFDVDFVKCQIQIKEGSWEGVRRKYWHSDEYFLPICVFRGGKKGGEADIKCIFPRCCRCGFGCGPTSG